jgi:hypothetical protein
MASRLLVSSDTVMSHEVIGFQDYCRTRKRGTELGILIPEKLPVSIKIYFLNTPQIVVSL